MSLISFPYPLSILLDDDDDSVTKLFGVGDAVCETDVVFRLVEETVGGGGGCRCRLFVLFGAALRFCSSMFLSFFFSRVSTFGNEKNGMATINNSKPHKKKPPHHIPIHRRSLGSEIININ